MLGLQSFDIGFDFVYGVVAPLVFAVIHNFVYGLICLRFSMVFVLALTVLMVSAVLMVLCVFLNPCPFRLGLIMQNCFVTILIIFKCFCHGFKAFDCVCIGVVCPCVL